MILSFLMAFGSFFSKYSKGSVVSLGGAIIVSIVVAFISDRHEQNGKIIKEQKDTLILNHRVSMSEGKLKVLENDSKTHVTRSSWNSYINHADHERDLVSAQLSHLQESNGDLTRAVKDNSILIYQLNDRLLYLSPKNNVLTQTKKGK